MSYTLLTDNDKKITQPESIKIDLMNHQKTMVYKMIDIESRGIISINDYSMKKYSNMFNVTGTTAEINTNISILGDKVGSGKTLMIITLLTVKKTIDERHIELGGSQFYSLKLKPSSQLIKSNLIIVPHKLLPQWKDAFEKIYHVTL
jgi:SNF2 family DNA or RNA helicase